MPSIPIPEPGFYEHIINRPESTIVHFWDSAAAPPTQEFQILESGNHPGSGRETFLVDVSNFSVPDAPSDVPVTILFRAGQQLDTAVGGDIDKFFQLLQAA
ncbi:hypothetical protein BDV33DRAFT_174514 [Aspergillus novoparasiticus]|uniref:Uncharacterized protein n=1 Tax=Aspergillus novoparasiticus TaxID=986946 RepID=A0A5N6ENH9_9EURO|nr:hypothetical protein BDV33DRAFT_174514 [Aspergillus novoparasiticus]